MSEGIKKTRLNIGNYPYLNNTLFSQLFSYKIVKYDAEGGLEAADWDVLYMASKSLLYFGLNAYLSYLGYNVVENSDYRLLQLIDEVNPELHKKAYQLMITNAETQEKIKELYNKIIELIEKELIPKEVWSFLGADKVLDWTSHIDRIIELKKLSIDIGWPSNNVIASQTTLEMLLKWKEFTNKVFYEGNGCHGITP